jgi:AcrR family transcriptional regulator
MMSGSGNGAATSSADPLSGRERVMRAAYELFSREGVRSVGIDTVIAEAGVAKMTLYRNFPSKEGLVLAFLQRREELWTHGWVRAEVSRRTDTPAGRLLAIFEIFDEWFHRPDFEGCAFVSILLETSDLVNPIRQACVEHLANIRGILTELAEAAGIEDSDAFARQWHILMKGSIVAAGEGDADAARRARELGELLLRQHGIMP